MTPLIHKFISTTDQNLLLNSINLQILDIMFSNVIRLIGWIEFQNLELTGFRNNDYLICNSYIITPKCHLFPNPSP